MTPPPDGDAVTLAVVGAQLQHLTATVDRLADALTAQRTEFVGRNEWLMRNSAVDDAFRAQGREVGDLRTELRSRTAEVRTELRSRRLPWPSVAAVVVATVALAVQIVPALAR